MLSGNETLYVQRMSRYLAGSVEVLALPPSIGSIDVQSLHMDSRGVTDAALGSIYWYSRSVLTGRLIVYQDYEVLRCDRSYPSANWDHPHNSLETLLRIQLSQLLAVPPMLLNNPLPPNLSIPKPMIISFFTEFVDNLSLLERPHASTRFEKSLHWGVHFHAGRCGCYGLLFDRFYFAFSRVNPYLSAPRYPGRVHDVS